MGKDNYKIYMHIFPDDKKYIGITKQLPYSRWGYNGNGYKNQPVYDVIQKYGWNNIKHVIIKENLDLSEAQKLEKYYISKYNSINNGYNSAPGGGAGGQSWVKITYNDKEYTPEQIASMSCYNITSHDITTRIKRGWSVERSIKQSKLSKNRKFKYKDNYYTINDLYSIRKNKELTKSQIKNRILKHNWDIERAITQSNNKKIQPKGIGNCLFEYKGKMYTSYELVQLSPVKELKPVDITTRINKHGWDVEKAINTPKKKRNVLFDYNGKKYTSKQLAEISPIDGLKSYNITDRIRLGWSIERAVNTPLSSN